MKHSSMQILVSASIDAELTSDEEAVVQQHLRECPSCREFVSDIRTQRAHIQRAADIEMYPGFAERVTRKVHQSSEESLAWLGIELSAKRTVFALGFLAAVWITFFSVSSLSEPVRQPNHALTMLTDTTESIIVMNAPDISRNDVALAVLTK